MTVRADIVAALEGVDGLGVATSTPSPVHPGHAWPVWASATFRNACVTDATWYVFVALPAGVNAATVDAGDQLVAVVALALFTVGKVTRVEPWQWPAEPGGQAYPVLRFTLETS